MSSLGELIEAFRSNELKLPALFDALSARGPISDDEYARERAEVERLHGDREFNPELAQALLAKLDSLRARPAAQAPAANEDMTAVRPANPRRASDEATVVAPVSRPAPQEQDMRGASAAAGEPEPEDATVVLPATGGKPAPEPEPANDSDTRVRAASSPAPVANEADGADAEGAAHETGGTSPTGGTGSSSWKRIADAAGGDYATLGMLLKGRFLLEREIGRGGMGVVFVARDERKVEARDRDPYVAVKVLNDEFRRHPDSLIALQRESRRSQQLAHDNIVRVYDFDKDGTVVFMTMEYIDGSDLKTLIR
ncbi:MAG TPA: protein kinase, partial [Rhodanobacteraceae bacterium]|nr:protein kinase [Rhodanobacteraceae bacterium]